MDINVITHESLDVKTNAKRKTTQLEVEDTTESKRVWSLCKNKTPTTMQVDQRRTQGKENRGL